MKRAKKMKTTKANSRLMNLLVPKGLLAVVDSAADSKDTDRAKWVRDAIREKLEREGSVFVSSETA